VADIIEEFIGLGSVDNTSGLNTPIRPTTQPNLNFKASTADTANTFIGL
jgi:hypothetical protein